MQTIPGRVPTKSIVLFEPPPTLEARFSIFPEKPPNDENKSHRSRLGTIDGSVDLKNVTIAVNFSVLIG